MRSRLRWFLYRLAGLFAPLLYLVDWLCHATGIGHVWGPF